MILPNKLISFHDCILGKTVYILNELGKTSCSATELYKRVVKHFDDLNEFIIALDVLFVLERIEIDEELQVIKYVEND